jgi:hypothetical protein
MQRHGKYYGEVKGIADREIYDAVSIGFHTGTGKPMVFGPQVTQVGVQC